MKDIWICGDCRSVNPEKSRRCYKCHVPRETGEMTEATAALGIASAAEMRTVLAQATRLGARYRPSWPLAILVVPLIVTATVLSFAHVDAWSAMLAPDGRYIENAARLDRLTTITAMMLAAYGASLVLWSLWIAVVVANVPALTARWPAHSPLGAFFAPFIPFVGLKRPHSVVRGVLAILSEGRAGPRLVALAWWVLLLATYFLPTIVVYFGGSGEQPSLTILKALNARLVLLVPAAIFAIAVVLIVEREQRTALHHRAIAVFAGQGAQAPDGAAAYAGVRLVSGSAGPAPGPETAD